MSTKKTEESSKNTSDKQVIQVLIEKIQKIIKDDKAGAQKAAQIISEMMK